MSVNLICYGVREVEFPYFNDLNKYNYQTTLVENLLNKENLNLIKGHNSVMLRGNCHADREVIKTMAGYGVKNLLTRTVGFNHIDIDAAKEYGMKIARVPGYSPNAISELALTLAMTLLRSTTYTVNKTMKRDFTADPMMFSPEIRNCTVGIIGTGKIGLTTARLFKGLGADVIAYDVYENESAKDIVRYVSMDELQKKSDVISIHCPYFKESNYHMIDDSFIENMKNNSILINTARGELQDIEAVIRGVESGKLKGFGTDVLEGEHNLFFKNLEGKTLDPTTEKLINLFPKVMITPHIGSYTDEALTNMVEISYDNLNDILTKGYSINEL